MHVRRSGHFYLTRLNILNNGCAVFTLRRNSIDSLSGIAAARGISYVFELLAGVTRNALRRATSEES